MWVDATAAAVLVFFFLAAIVSYIVHGALRDTTNQFERPDRGMHVVVVLLIAGEMGGFAVLLAGYAAGHLF